MTQRHNLAHIDTFLFDLDNVLYPHGSFLNEDEFWHAFASVAAEDNNIPFEEAVTRTKDMMASGVVDVITEWQKIGNFTLERFTCQVDSVDLADRMQPCHQTHKGLDGLNGRKIVFTNAHTSHAQRVLAHLELHDFFEHVSCYMSRDYVLKPEARAYEGLVTELEIEPNKAVMLEDTVKNLEPAKDMGMSTVYIHPDPKAADKSAPFVDVWYPDLVSWLNAVEQ